MGAVDVARESIDAFNAGDWDRFRTLHAEGVVEEELGTQRRIEGIDALLESNQGWKQAFPDASGEVTNAFESGDTAVLEITWSGTQSGPLEMPNGQLPASNKRAELRGCQVFRVEGDRIAESRHYFDMATMLQQLGMAAAPGSRGEWVGVQTQRLMVRARETATKLRERAAERRGRGA